MVKRQRYMMNDYTSRGVLTHKYIYVDQLNSLTIFIVVIRILYGSIEPANLLYVLIVVHQDVSNTIFLMI